MDDTSQHGSQAGEGPFDRALTRMRRQRAADRDDADDFLFEIAADDIIERCHAVNRTFAAACDLGCGDGRIGRQLVETGKVEHAIGLDGAFGWARNAPFPAAVGDEEALPLRAGHFDLVVSAMALHWVNDLPGALIQIRNALKPDGLLLATMLGGDTLIELKTALIEAESEITGGASPRVSPFADVRDLGGLLQRAGLALAVADTDRLTVRYAEPMALIAELRRAGAQNALTVRSRMPLGARVLARACEIYRDQFADGDGRVRATFQLVHLTGWAPDPSQRQPLRPGSAKARLADALKTQEQPAGEKTPVPRG